MECVNVNAVLIKRLYKKYKTNFNEKVVYVVTNEQIQDAIKYYKICNCSNCINCKIRIQLENEVVLY